jgi:hypothetical protein
MKAKAMIWSLLASAAVACAPAPVTAETRSPACGTHPGDWCPSPPDDPCGRHPDAKACGADPACYGMPYQGESLVACEFDKRGFSSNCPAVGCTSVPPKPPAK